MSLRERIIHRFQERPLLLLVVRGLLFSTWVRILFILALLAPLVAFGLLARIWRVSPAGFRPEIRIGGLDRIQARSLHRTALRDLAERRVGAAFMALEVAMANNPADVGVLGSFLRAAVEEKEGDAYQGAALGRVFWLLRLDGTNVANLELCVPVLERNRLEEHALSLMLPFRGRLNDALTKSFLRAAFNAGRPDLFDAAWAALAPDAPARRDPDMELYRAAFVAGWKGRGTSEPGLDRLLAASSGAEPSVLARRLLLRVRAQRADVTEYWETLRLLSRDHEDHVLEHVVGWRLLLQAGRGGEALERARGLRLEPSTALETIALARAWFELGLREEAIRILERFVPGLAPLDGVWVEFAALLEQSAQWVRLRELALNLRLQPDVSARLAGFSHYLEGRAELGLGRTIAADQAFGQIRQHPITDSVLGVAVAKSLLSLEKPALAESILRGLEAQEGRSAAYWELVLTSAYAQKDEAGLLRAARKAYELEPERWTSSHNLTTALLVSRRNPDEAVRLSMEVERRQPELPAVRLNRAAALAQVRRHEEAEILLAGLKAEQFAGAERAAYQLTCVEVLAARGRLELARVFLEELHVDALFPSQRSHVDRLRRDVAAGAAGAK
jgi:tetratricopeptide (TPR) repeat protein